jgi:hypothetical protein
MVVADPRFSGSIAQRQMGCAEEQYDLSFNRLEICDGTKLG